MALYEEDDEYDIEGEESVLLDEELDENYEPTDEEIIEYAQFLGMDLREDGDLLYIAKEGLKAPLPENYKPYKRRTGEIVYIDLTTNEFQEEHPCDEYYRNLYQEMKRKKSQKQTGSKFKKNFPFANKLNAPGGKVEALPDVQASSGQKKNDNKNNLDKSIGSEHHDSFSSHQEGSLGNLPGPLINKDTKKKHFGSNLQNSDLKSSMGVSAVSGASGGTELEGGFEELDQEFEDKFFKYYKDREQEFNTHKKKYKTEQENYEAELRKKLEQDKKGMKDKLKAGEETVRKKLEKEKENLKKEMENRFNTNVEEEIKKLDKQHFANKREIDKTQTKNLEDELKIEEKRIEKEFQEKKQALLQRKSEIEQEINKLKKMEQEKENEFNNEFETEKETITRHFQIRLREVEVEERLKQQNEMDRYKKEMLEKLQDEKKVLAVAKNQKQTLITSKKEELKESYDRKYALEKEKVDIQIMDDLKKFEEKERIKKDSEIEKIQQLELKQQREKKQAQFQNEVKQLQENYKKRLATYQQVLKEKYDKQINIINDEMAKALEITKKQVENIKLNVNTKEEMMNEIARFQSNNSAINQQIQETEGKISKQKVENSNLQQKLDGLRKSYTVIQQNTAQAVEKLKKEVQEKDKQIDLLLKKKRKSPEYFYPTEKGSKHNRSNTRSQADTSLNKIMKDLKEIKSFITFSKPKEEEKFGNYFNGFRAARINTNYSEKRETFNKRSKSVKEKLAEDWIEIYQNESNRVEALKRDLRKDKIDLKRAQENLLEEQERFKEEFSDFKSSNNRTSEKKSALKRQKKNLNEQIQRLNDDVYRFREAEIHLKNKESLLEELGKAIRRISLRDFDSDELDVIYRQYQDLDIDPQNLLTKQSKATEQGISVEEPQEFYKRWESIVENQLSLDVETSVDDNKVLKEKRPHHNYSEIIDRPIHIEDKKHNNTKEPKSTKNSDYNYQNLIKILDIKLKTDLKGPENDYARKQRYQSTDHRYKMSIAFSEHSEWLKNMKTQLNRQLYERPQSASTLIASRF